jgi:hypothetical protein
MSSKDLMQLTMKGMSLTRSLSSSRTGKQKLITYSEIGTIVSSWDMVCGELIGQRTRFVYSLLSRLWYEVTN